ncbi:uncharacterized protein LOC128738266 [Sabethes cyaneus]|uniref:uncharacterized protein LOC128738266 n=1 Tax=Sabethes cyaneus TaxID=53552 RepID=UPI00237DAFF0|nr:uncharacterized protein LOC128738266 [Sabethes cyaneus]
MSSIKASIKLQKLSKYYSSENGNQIKMKFFIIMSALVLVMASAAPFNPFDPSTWNPAAGGNNWWEPLVPLLQRIASAFDPLHIFTPQNATAGSGSSAAANDTNSG